VLAHVQAEVQRQVRAVDEAMRQAEGAFEADLRHGGRLLNDGWSGRPTTGH
jgi:hypothetical protein